MRRTVARGPDDDPDQVTRNPNASSDRLFPRDYLIQHGRRLIDNGYLIVPISPGAKKPALPNWSKLRTTPGDLNEWINDPAYRECGVGILTKHTPAIDIDIRDEEVAGLIESYIREKMGGTLMRVGQYPKRLFLFRCEEPMAKARTTVRRDFIDAKQQIEVLGEGQQFVAYHIHPDTGKPYTWPDDGMNPLEIKAEDLPLLQWEQIRGLFEYFESIADAEGWDLDAAPGKSKQVTKTARGEVDKDNPFVEDTPRVELSDTQVKKFLMLMPGAEDYEIWYQVGMALYHQFDGSDVGLSMWKEWSETATNYDENECDNKWSKGGFDITGKKRAPLTFAWIMKEADAAAKKTAIETGTSLRRRFAECNDAVLLKELMEETAKAEIDRPTRWSIAEVAREAWNRINHARISVADMRKLLAFKMDTREKPTWVTGWIWDTSDDKFVDTKSKMAVTTQSFNAMFDREALTKQDVLEGREQPSATASALALNVYKMRHVRGRRYEPGEDAIYHSAEGTFANTYSERELPEVPETLTPADISNVERVKRHIVHLLEDEREQAMLLDFLSWVVQNPGEHANYGVVLQGTQGDGKSFIGEMMRAVMGVSNVRMLNAHILESDFTDWAYGQCLACFEEVRLVNHSKWETINRIKPYITNNFIEVHPKGKAVINVRNTTNYLLFTNYKDALPLNDNDRRYLVLFSRWQRKSDLDDFMQKNPAYYERLYTAIVESAGAIRGWLLKHKQSDEFKPKGHAPVTQGWQFMVDRAKPEFVTWLEEVIETKQSIYADDVLIDLTNLKQDVADFSSVEWPAAKAISSMLERAGWEALGQVKLPNGERSNFYSRDPERFRRTNKAGKVLADSYEIAAYMAKLKDDRDPL